jgi:hypothetical protein
LIDREGTITDSVSVFLSKYAAAPISVSDSIMVLFFTVALHPIKHLSLITIFPRTAQDAAKKLKFPISV